MSSQKTDAFRLLTDEAQTFVGTIKTLRRLEQATRDEAMHLDDPSAWTDVLSRQRAQVSPEKLDLFNATMAEAMPFILALSVRGAKTYTVIEDDDGPELEWTETNGIDLLPEQVREGVARIHESARGSSKVEPDFKMFSAEGRKARFEISDPEIRLRFWACVEEIQREAAAPSHVALLMRSLLTMAVGSFEVLVSNVYRSHLICNPNAAQSADSKIFSLQDLYDFGTVDDAVAESIFQQADSFSRKGVRAWAAWFGAKPLEIELDELALDWDRTQEVFERRNVIIHNGSRATRQYLNNVASRLTEDLHEGDPLEATPEYVDQALTRMMTLGVLLVFCVRMKLFKRETLETTSGWISDRQFDLLIDEKYDAVEKIAAVAARFPLVEATAVILKVNGWIARMSENQDSCRSEIEAWDTSALAPRYQAAREVLLGNYDTAIPLIRSCLDDGSLTVPNLTNWPLFKWMREDNSLNALLEDIEESTSVPVVELPPVGAQGSDDLGIDSPSGPDED